MTLRELGLDRPNREKPRSASFVDPLTGLGNAVHLEQTVFTLAAERANDPASFTIALANLDGFKPINDLFGPERATKFCARWRIG